jgi:uncharacterized protein (DUF433 family)
MLEAKIIDRGRGPEIAGTRITVYDVLDYFKSGWQGDMIADTLELSSRQVEIAIRYIEEHRDEVMEAKVTTLAGDQNRVVGVKPASPERGDLASNPGGFAA